MNTLSISYKRHRFPPAIITHSVWLYCRFNLSLREVEEMFLQRGVHVSYETIRRWVAKFGQSIAREPRPGNIWHLDEVVVKIRGRKYWFWRAVDQDGLVLDEILQSKRNTQAAKRLLRRLMKQYGSVPKRIITDKMRSYGAAKRAIAPGVEHISHKELNNRAENSHLPFRKRERAMQGYRSLGGLQRFISIHSAIRNCFVVPESRRSALTIRYHRLEANKAWNVAAMAT